MADPIFLTVVRKSISSKVLAAQGPAGLRFRPTERQGLIAAALGPTIPAAFWVVVAAVDVILSAAALPETESLGLQHPLPVISPAMVVAMELM